MPRVSRNGNYKCISDLMIRDLHGFERCTKLTLLNSDCMVANGTLEATPNTMRCGRFDSMKYSVRQQPNCLVKLNR